MSNDQFLYKDQTKFESIEKVNQHGIEYWSARDLQQLLGYKDIKNGEEFLIGYNQFDKPDHLKEVFLKKSDSLP
jgi:hypothetical protein